MPAIELSKPGVRDEYFKRHIIVDGQLVSSSQVEVRDADDEAKAPWSVTVHDMSEAGSLTKHKFEDLGIYLKSLGFPVKIALPHFKGIKVDTDLVIVFGHRDTHDGKPDIRFTFAISVFDWDKPYSLSTLFDSMQLAALQSHGEFHFENEQRFINTVVFYLSVSVRNSKMPIESEISYWSRRVGEFVDDAGRQSQMKMQPASLISEFEFPEQLKTACQQYLVYFAQFLKDLGIEAKTNIEENAGRVLFSVTPQDSAVALGKVKEALEIYLDLPQNPGFGTAAGQFSDVAVSQLKANVFFLQSQLTLAQSVLEAKNATIEALNATIFQQRRYLAESAVDTAKSEGGMKQQSDSEPILGDTVHITKYEGKMFRVDLPTILRRLKRSFGVGGGGDR